MTASVGEPRLDGLVGRLAAGASLWLPRSRFRLLVDAMTPPCPSSPNNQPYYQGFAGLGSKSGHWGRQVMRNVPCSFAISGRGHAFARK